MFGNGPRRSLPLHASYDPTHRNKANALNIVGNLKVLNFSGVNDELQDFELNIRNVSGSPVGLITDANGADIPSGATANAVIRQLDASATAGPNSGRNKHLDAMAFYVATGIKTPITPVSLDAAKVTRGRQVFAQANCASCHGGTGWSTARVNYAPTNVGNPRPVLTLATGTTTPNGDIRNDDGGVAQLRRFLADVGTFFSNTPNEVRLNATGATVRAAGTFGYAPPSLLGIGAMGPYLHNGSALTLASVLDNPAHRRAGTGVDILSNPQDRNEASDLVTFLKSIDDKTIPIQPTPGVGTQLPTP
jgi:mono/diheme cytochrome c family protein